MDAELRELERLFEAAQQAKPSARLSDRNVVELVMKLQELGLLDADLLHTVSGKEYITQDRLRLEMEAEIKRQGRVSLVDMASLIGVDYFHCERQAEHIKRSNPSIMFEQGEIFTTDYWDSLAEEVNETLKEASHVSLGELATRFNVGVELLTGILSSRIGKLVHAKHEGGQLYTPAYVARVKAMVRGAVRALTVPTTVQSVWAFLQAQLREIDGNGVTGENLFYTVLLELLSEGSIKGTLRGGGSTWTPAVFAHSQRESVEAFYSQNSYITYEALRKLNIPQPKQYLQTKYPEGIALESVFVHDSYVSLLDSAAEEAITGGGWFDALDVVPSAFGSPGKLLLMCPSVQRALKESAVSLVAETCIVGTEFVKGLLGKFKTIVRETQEQKSFAVGGSGAKDEHGDSDTALQQEKSKTKKLEKNPKDQGMQDMDTEDDEETNVKSGRNKKRGGKSKASKKGTMKEASRVSKSSSSDENEVPSEEKLAEKIIEWYPELEVAGTEDGSTGVLAKSLATQLRPPLMSYLVSLKRSCLGAKAEESRKRTDALRLKITEEYANLQLYSKALDLFGDDKTTEAVLNKHLLRTSAADIADLLLETQALETSENKDPFPSKPFTPAVRMSLAKSLPGSVSSAAVDLVDALEGKKIASFESALESALKESGLRVKKLDKKGERSLLHAYRKSLAEQVDREGNAIALLPRVVALLFAQHHGRALQAPGRAMSSAVSRLKTVLPARDYGVLEQYHAITVAFLSSNSADETKKQFLQQQMGELKALTHAAVAQAKLEN